MASQWPRLHDWPNKEPYFRELISSYFCPALFSVDNLDSPVVFLVLFPCNVQFGWASEKIRGKGLLYDIALLHGIQNDMLPFETEISFPSRIQYEKKKYGAILSGYKVKDLVVDRVFCKL